MSAAAIATSAPAQPLDGFVGQRKISKASQDPHLSRFAYMPGVYYAQANPRTTGYKFFPQGTLIQFETFESGGHYNPDFYENGKASPSMVREISAALAVFNAEIEYTTREDITSGFVALPMLTGLVEAREIFDLLHPPFAAFEHECPSGLLVCPTCRVQWLESERSKAYFNANGDGLDRDITLKVKEALYTSNQSYAEFCQTQWEQLIDQYERTRTDPGGRLVFSKAHHHYRKCAHLPTIAENAAPVVTVSGGTNDLDRMTDQEKAEFYAWRAQKQGTKQPDVAESLSVNIGDTVRYGDLTTTVLAKRFGRFQLEGVEKDVTRDEISLLEG